LARLTFEFGPDIIFLMDMKSDPTKEPEFQRVLGNLLKAPPKPHADMKLGKATGKKAKSPAKRGASAKPKT
jgi:hypothetical protein